MSDSPLEISPEDAKQLLERGDPVFLVDVREPQEHALARIEGALLMPMQTVPSQIASLEDRDEALIIICHHGVRSLHTAAWLRERGVENAQSLAGGIDAWSRRIDPSIPRY